MPVVTVSNIQGLNLKMNPLQIDSGEMIRCLNMKSYHFGSKKKREGYGTAMNQLATGIDKLWNWTKDDGTTSYNYALSGSVVYFKDLNLPTHDWIPCTNGTVSNTDVGFGFLEDTMIIGDGVTNTRHTTNGTSFTDTTLAPKASQFVDYQQRIYAMGTASDLFYSTTGDATNWNTSGTSDSSSIHIPGPGKLTSMFKVSDRIMLNKGSGDQFRWDGYNLYDICTSLAPTSSKSLDQTDGYFFGLNRVGIFGYSGSKPELLSNKAEKQIYNDRGGGIYGLTFNTAPGVVHRFDYFLSIGDVTDDLTSQTITDCILKYDYQTNEFSDWKFFHKPSAWVSFVNPSGVKKLWFGDANGNTFEFGGERFDNDQPIPASMEFVYHGQTLQQKKWNYFRALFNPGCEASVQIAVEDTYTRSSKRWIDLGQATSGVVEFKFPPDYRRGRILFIKINEASRNGSFEFYGYEVDAELVPAP